MKPIDVGRDPIWSIYEGLAKEAEAKVREHWKPSRRFRASEIHDCRRKIYYRLAGYVPMPQYQWLELVGASGDAHHDLFRYYAHHFDFPIEGIEMLEDGSRQRELDNMAKDFEYQGTKFTLSCRPDGLKTVENKEAVLEIKTMTGYRFDKFQTAWKKLGNGGLIETLKLEKPQYLWQGNQTAMIVEREYVYLVCIDRNLNRVGFSTNGFGKPSAWEPLAGDRAGGAFWQVEEDDRLNILSKAAEITQALDDGKPPEPEFVSSSDECKQCPFLVYCHGKKKGMEFPLKGVL